MREAKQVPARSWRNTLCLMRSSWLSSKAKVPKQANCIYVLWHLRVTFSGKQYKVSISHANTNYSPSLCKLSSIFRSDMICCKHHKSPLTSTWPFPLELWPSCHLMEKEQDGRATNWTTPESCNKRVVAAHTLVEPWRHPLATHPPMEQRLIYWSL